MFIQKSKNGNNKVGAYLGTIIIVLIFSQLVGALPLAAVVSAFKISGGAIDSSNILNPVAMGIDQNFFLVLMIVPFVVGLLGLWFGITFIHKKKVLDVITGRNKLDWKRIFFGAFIWGVLFLISLLASYISNPTSFEFQFQPVKFIILFFIAFLFIPFQSSFEEIVFRGYFMQGISLIFKNKWVPLLLTSALFGLMHIANPEIKEFGIAIMLPQYILLGLFFGIMVLMDDGLELAIGVHAINNIFSALFITHKSSVLQTPALFKTNTINPEFELISLIIACVIFIFIVAKKYKWASWKTLFKKVEFVEIAE